MIEKTDPILMQVASHDPTILVIFGGTGDLARRKLLPALFDLFVRGALPERFSVLGFSRQELTHDEYREKVREALSAKSVRHSAEALSRFLEMVFYVPGVFDESSSYGALTDALKSLEAQYGQCANRLMYLAVAPSFYETIFKHLKSSGLSEPCSKETGWTRILVEKPFGSDLASAEYLEEVLAGTFQEDQIFRIDHYLTKEAIQNILTFRFSNVLFESSWDRNYIEYVHISFFETLGVEERGSFYDSIGTLRDVGQNHMLQMLALIAMDNPGELDARMLRTARSEVLNSLRRYSTSDLPHVARRGQYKGYKDITGVNPHSTTETYFFVKAFIDNERWKGVPFYLEAGKALDKKEGAITIKFKSAEQCVCGPYSLGEYRNTLKITAEPHQSVNVRFWAKKPGLVFGMEPRDMIFDCDERVITQSADAYEKILYDCIAGDQTLFVSTDEVRSAWKFITPIVEGWDSVPLYEYEKGSHGPERIESPGHTKES